MDAAGCEVRATSWEIHMTWPLLVEHFRDRDPAGWDTDDVVAALE
jgi:hypothetical protein